MELLKSQKNQLLEIIKAHGLEPFNFEWEFEEIIPSGSIASNLSYKDSQYFFSIKVYEDKFDYVYSPGYQIIVERDTAHSWEFVTNSFVLWINYLKREIEQPDLWEELEKIKLFENIEYESENTMQQFTYQETLQIENGINEIRSYLTELVEDNTNQVKLVNEKLDYLIDASKRMGRLDWKNIFVGALVNIATSIALNPEQAKHVATLFQQAVSGLMKLLS